MNFYMPLLFSVIFIIWKENRPVNANVFYVYLPIIRAEHVVVSDFGSFYQQICHRMRREQ